MFSLAVLRRYVWAGKAKKDALGKKEISILVIIKFFTIVTLYETNWETKMS
jgi:hypothetical protein